MRAPFLGLAKSIYYLARGKGRMDLNPVEA